MKRLALLLACIAMTGCASIVQRSVSDRWADQNGKTYPGVRFDAFAVHEIVDFDSWSPVTCLEGVVWVGALAVDFPCSAVFDTIMLPYDLRRKSHER